MSNVIRAKNQSKENSKMSKTTKVSKEKENDIADGHYMYRLKSALGLRSTNPISRNKQVKSTSVTICLLNVIGFNAVKCNLTKLTTKSSFWSVLLVSAIGMVLQAQCHLPLYKAKHVPVWFIIDMFLCGLLSTCSSVVILLWWTIHGILWS